MRFNGLIILLLSAGFALAQSQDKSTHESITNKQSPPESVELLAQARAHKPDANEVNDFMAAISDAVETERGWGKKDIERMLRLQLMRRSSVHIHPQLKSIDWRHDGEEEAEVKLAVAMAATAFSLEDLARINADLMLFTVTFRQHNGEYKITQARWQRARPLDFL